MDSFKLRCRDIRAPAKQEAGSLETKNIAEYGSWQLQCYDILKKKDFVRFIDIAQFAKNRGIFLEVWNLNLNDQPITKLCIKFTKKLNQIKAAQHCLYP